MPTEQTLQPEDHFAGKYRIVRRLGEGGMGEVYEAQNKWTSRRVAIKLLRRELASQADVVQRFVQEGRSTTMIAHPNIVDVLDMGRDARSGRFYMVQEYLTGVGLDNLLDKRGTFNVRDSLDIILPIMGGLAAAHRRGVIHRDVKPENIIMTQTPLGAFVPKLIDFGIAKLVGAKRIGTNPRVLLGTPHYMSPEQLDEADEVDQQTDIWAVGVVLYEMLTGCYPFDADGVHALYMEICEGMMRPLDEVAPSVPSSLAAVIHDALDRDRQRRHASMEAFLGAIMACPELDELAHGLGQRHRDSLPYNRRHERYPVHWSCEVVCKKWQRALSLVASNISQGGVFIASDSPPEPNTQVGIDLRLPDGSHVHLRGTVLRAITPTSVQPDREAGFAVRFSDEHATDLTVLEQMAAAHREPGYESLPESTREGRDTLADSPAPAVPSKPTADREPRASRNQRATPVQPNLSDAVGIDFGTTYSSIAIALDDKVYAIPDAKERTLHPSVVYYPQRGQPLVGWEARRFQLEEPKRVITSVKRVLGRTFDEPMLQGYLHSLPCDAVAGPGRSVLFEVDGTQIAPIQVASEQLDFLRRVAESRTGKELRKVVVSVPLTFGEPQRRALERAAAIAGLEVLELISEPVAAVIAYGFGQGRRETVAVYDFGGGTFDFSILELDGDDYQVLSMGGDPWLGGDDFDLAIAHEAANRFWRDTRTDLRQLAVEWQRLLFASEQAKRTLSNQPETELALHKAIERPQPIDLRWKLDQQHVEQLCSEIFYRSLEVCRRSLAAIDLDRSQIDRVVITGGTSRIPFLQRELTKYFDKEVTAVVDPELSVCIGTGLRAARLTEHRVHEAAHRNRPPTA